MRLWTRASSGTRLENLIVDTWTVNSDQISGRYPGWRWSESFKRETSEKGKVGVGEGGPGSSQFLAAEACGIRNLFDRNDRDPSRIWLSGGNPAAEAESVEEFIEGRLVCQAVNTMKSRGNLHWGSNKKDDRPRSKPWSGSRRILQSSWDEMIDDYI